MRVDWSVSQKGNFEVAGLSRASRRPIAIMRSCAITAAVDKTVGHSRVEDGYEAIDGLDIRS